MKFKIDIQNLVVLCIVLFLVIGLSSFIMIEHRKEMFTIYKKRIKYLS